MACAVREVHDEGVGENEGRYTALLNARHTPRRSVCIFPMNVAPRPVKQGYFSPFYR